MSLTSCLDDTIDLPRQELQGKIDDQEWVLGSAGAFVQSTTLQYRFLFTPGNFGTVASDPCVNPSPTQPHVSMVFRPRLGSFSLPLASLNEEVRIHFQPGSNLLAAAGILEIIDINNGQVFGYLQAIVDDETTVEGSFVAILCN
ncbi:MAG: hypothetical protein AAF789_08460 [Bacteroidota bacterium]